MRDPTLRRDASLAVGLALLLGAGWTWAAWHDLVRLRLPDTDDVMRLVEVRDWLAGQGWADLMQHRLGPGAGVAMHWTRLADLAPGALIAALTPPFGRHAAEVAAVIAVPVALFAAALTLIARIARTLAPDLAATATVVAALAYPATTVFLPGRIDHHGLQLVLMLVATLAAVRPASDGGGVAIGLAAAASLVIGLETAPILAAIGLAGAIGWAAGEDRGRSRLAGIGVGALVGLGIARGLFRPEAWTYPACDGFDARSWQGALPLAALPLALALGAPRLRGPAARWRALILGAGVALALAVARAPSCLSPYGGVDRFVAAHWLAHVGEAQAAWQSAPATAIAYLGLAVAGLAATARRALVDRTRGWVVLGLALAAATAIAAVQLRGAYAAALLAAPGLAASIAAARRRGTVPLAGAWIASAGLAYPIAAQAMAPAQPDPVRGGAGGGDCVSDALLGRLATLPPGTVLAPIDAGPLLLERTAHRVVAAPYHRDDAGIAAALRLSGARARGAAAILSQVRADYLVRCAPAPLPPPPGWRKVTQFDGGGAILARGILSGPPPRP